MNIAVFCASSRPQNTEYITLAEALGRTIAEHGHTLVYGGSNLGLMGAVSGAALAAGGRVVGVIPTLFSTEVIHSQPVTELITVATMAERKERIIGMSDAFVALPGGVGTLDEVSEVLVANQLLHLNRPMFLLNTGGFYDPLLEQLNRFQAEGMMRADVGLRAVQSLDFLNTL